MKSQHAKRRPIEKAKKRVSLRRLPAALAPVSRRPMLFEQQPGSRPPAASRCHRRSSDAHTNSECHVRCRGGSVALAFTSLLLTRSASRCVRCDLHAAPHPPRSSIQMSKRSVLFECSCSSAAGEEPGNPCAASTRTTEGAWFACATLRMRVGTTGCSWLSSQMAKRVAGFGCSHQR